MQGTSGKNHRKIRKICRMHRSGFHFRVAYLLALLYSMPGRGVGEVERADARFKPMRSWAFITPHARVLLAVAQDPELRVEKIAEAACVTERSAYRILADLVAAGYLRRRRAGRRNRYELDRDLPLGDPTVEEHTTDDLLSLIDG
jgi:hypothetical protein